MDFFRQNFDKLLLLFLFLILIAIVIHMTHDAPDAPVIHWAREQAALVLGGLLGLITGRYLEKKAGAPEPPMLPKEENVQKAS